MKRLLVLLGVWSWASSLVLAQDAGVEAAPPPALPAAVSIPAPNEQTPSVQPDAAPEETPMTQAELEALGMNVNQGGVDTSLQFSGFADFTFASELVSKSSIWRAAGVGPPHSTFYVGNFNLYIKKNLTETLRTMGEVRFSYLPNGSPDLTTGTRASTAAGDYSDYGRVMRWGGIEIERVYLEWSAHPLIAVRVGQFLTPYGIWNVDHGSPTYVPVQRPFVIGNSWFPERQTGIELFGRWDAVKNGTLGYHLTVSNGTGPVSEYLDLDENKAIGGRLYWEHHALGELRVGTSAYYGRDTAATSSFRIEPGGGISTSEKVDAQFDALGLAADVSWKYRGWQLQTEWITYQRNYTTKGRAQVQGLPGQAATFAADEFSWGMYALAGYRFSWLGVMPFVVIEHLDGSVQMRKAQTVNYQAGLNMRPVDALALKVVYYHIDFLTGANKDDPMRMILAQVAWAF